jgi:hypothetical protein
MCPECWSSLAASAAGVTSTGLAGALLIKGLTPVQKVYKFIRATLKCAFRKKSPA